MLFEAWDRHASLEEACIDYVRENSIKKPDNLMTKVGRLCLDKFTGFMKKASGALQSSVLIGLQKNWLKANSSKENLENMILGIDFGNVSPNDKFEFYRDVSQQMD